MLGCTITQHHARVATKRWIRCCGSCELQRQRSSHETRSTKLEGAGGGFAAPNWLGIFHYEVDTSRLPALLCMSFTLLFSSGDSTKLLFTDTALR